jgi:dephospho-CoA kinase
VERKFYGSSIRWGLNVQVIGLTGGIATGKSTVCAILQEAGAVIIDADDIARKLVRKGLPAYQEIIDHFGTAVLMPSGEINREVLGDIIFNDPHKKKLLNSIVHPRVEKELNRQLRQIEKSHLESIAVLDIPLLFEADMHRDLVEVIVVHTPPRIQLERLMQRDNISEANARARINSQMPIDEKKKRATRVIDNSGSIENTRRQTLELFERLKKRSS